MSPRAARSLLHWTACSARQESEDALIVVRSLEDAPLGLTIHHLSFRPARSSDMRGFGEEIKDAATHRSQFTIAMHPVGSAQCNLARPFWCGPDLPSHRLIRSKSFSQTVSSGSLAYELFKGIVDSAQPVYHTLELWTLQTKMDEAEEE